MSTEMSEGKVIAQWHKNKDGEYCWFRDGIPAVDGACVWCGKPSKGHVPIPIQKT